MVRGRIDSMKKYRMVGNLTAFAVISLIIFSSCGQSASYSQDELIVEPQRYSITPTTEIAADGLIEPVVTAAPKTVSAVIDDVLPAELVQQITEAFPRDESPESIPIHFSLIEKGIQENAVWQSNWVYVAAAAFPTVEDEITITEIRSIWNGSGDATQQLLFEEIIVSAESYALLNRMWGTAGPLVTVYPSSELVEAAWKKPGNILALIPFDALEPRWKVLRVDDQSVLARGFEADRYPLTVRIGAFIEAGNDQYVIDQSRLDSLPGSNRDESMMTVLLMTGVTALTRETAARMDQNGVDFPARDVLDWFQDADLSHLSNEVSFYSDCPSPIPVRAGGRFCSAIENFELLEFVGADIIELTGNHLKDWGEESFLETLDLYEENGYAIYGGGENAKAAQAVLKFTDHGNQIALIGCNQAGPSSVWASETSPGAALCDLDLIESQIEDLLNEGYLPIVTFQHYEACDPHPMSGQRVDFKRISEAGAVIVSGSQAHCPQGFTFVSGRLIHYGLGNLFFDQMYDWTRPAFLDRHILYNGKHIQTELLTTMLEDAARPRPMNAEERSEFLTYIFEESEW